MNRAKVVSSNIQAIGYDEGTLVLEVEFKDGGIYEYFEVGTSKYDKFMNASSKGKYFHRFIKGLYKEKKIS